MPMQPPSHRRTLPLWIQHWEAVAGVLPSFTMDWLYGPDGDDRLKHHQWMLARPSFIALANKVHAMLALDGDSQFGIMSKDPTFPDGKQREAALTFYHRLQQPDGKEISNFLFAAACEMTGSTPLCAYQEAQLRQWVATATQSKVTHFGHVCNLVINLMIQTMIWTVGCFPYIALGQKFASKGSLDFWLDPHLDGNRALLRNYSLSIYKEMTRVGRSEPRTYEESKVH